MSNSIIHLYNLKMLEYIIVFLKMLLVLKFRYLNIHYVHKRAL